VACGFGGLVVLLFLVFRFLGFGVMLRFGFDVVCNFTWLLGIWCFGCFVGYLGVMGVPE